MANINNTNPENPKKLKYKPRKVDWVWREELVSILKSRNVPHDHAETAIIDNRELFDTHHKNKLTPSETADVVLPLIESVYNKGVSYT